MPDPHDRELDQAALDELMRAFGEQPDDAVEPAPHAEPNEPDGDESAELLIVEQEPMEAPVDPTPTPPTVIRIDDYGGSAVIDPKIDDHEPPVESPEPQPGVDDEQPAVIAIDDEDLPDAVYVAGNLERSGTRAIVFIEDDDTGDTIAPNAERDVRRGIEPRLRERRAAVKRAIGRKRLRWILIVLLVVTVGVGALAVLGSGLFAVKAENVRVFGAVYADEAQVEAVVDDLVGTPTLRADTQAAEAALEAIPWVDEARVRVSFPNSATIEIREREAWTTYQGPDQRYRVLDREGRVLAVLDGYPIAYLLLAGPDPVDLDPGDFAPQGYAAASELAKNLTGSIRGQVSYISVTADGSRLSIFLDDETEVRFGAARDLFNKLLRLETTLANNPEREPGVIDVSTSEVTL
jgi:cell division protein FtsQ